MKLRWLLVGLLVVLLLVPALTLTVARLVQPDGGLWVRLVSFTPYALVLYVVAFLLLILATIRGRGRWRRAAGWLAVLSLGGAVLHGWWVSPLFLGSESGLDKLDQPERLTVMSANLMVGQASAARVVELAELNDADVLVLQEVTPAALDRLRIAGLDEALPHNAGAAAPGVAGTMVFADEPLTDVTALDTRVGGYAMIMDGDTTLFAVHPWPPVGDADLWQADQAAVRRVAADSNGPALVVGDFNATRDHNVVQELFDLGFRDAATEAKSWWQPTWPAGGEMVVAGIPVPPLMALDHVLVRGQSDVTNTETVTIPGTDHRALVATLVR